MDGKLTISVTEAARRLGISRPLAYQLVRRADFPAIQISEKRWLVWEAGLEDWVKAQVEKKGEIAV